jgi:hypothetical protein
MRLELLDGSLRGWPVALICVSTHIGERVTFAEGNETRQYSNDDDKTAD